MPPDVPMRWLRTAKSNHEAFQVLMFLIQAGLARHVRLMQLKMEITMLTQNAENTPTAEASASPVDKLGNLWCTLMHDSLSWPIHGHYTCLACGRRHSVTWEREEGPLTSPEALKDADLPASAEHLNSARAVLPNSTAAFARVQ
jgi:hypothetical protein